MNLLHKRSLLSWALIITILFQPLMIQSAYAGKNTEALRNAAVKIITVSEDLVTKVKDKAAAIAPKLFEAENIAAKKLSSVAKTKATNEVKTAAIAKAKDEYTKEKENIKEANKKFDEFEKITNFVINGVKFLKKWMINPTPGKAIAKAIDFMSLLSGVESETNAFVDKFLTDSMTIADGAFMAGVALSGMAAICACSVALGGVGLVIGAGAAECFAFSAMITTTIAAIKGVIYVGRTSTKAWATSVDKAKSLWGKWFGEKEIKEAPVDDINDTSKEEVSIEPTSSDIDNESNNSNSNSDTDSEYGADEPMIPSASTESSSNSGQADVAGLAAAEEKANAYTDADDDAYTETNADVDTYDYEEDE